MSDPYDFASEDWQWPEIGELRPAEAARILDDIERELSVASKRHDALKQRKSEAKAVVNQVLEEYEQEDVSFRNADGKKVRYTPYPFDVFSIHDEEAFKEWAAEEAENYYEPGLRKQVFLDEMRRRDQDGEPLPPGVQKYTDTRLSRSSTKG